MVDPALAAPPAAPELDDPADILSTLIFRSHPEMVRGSVGPRPPARRARPG